MKPTWLLIVAFMLTLNFNANAQYVTIPDPNFVAWLQNNGYDSCMNGNQLDTTCPAILDEFVIGCATQNITNLEGIQYFKNLQGLNCYDNHLTYLPPLPSTLLELRCYDNELTSLPPLPIGLNWLSCHNNLLTSLPILPATLMWLKCSNNQLTSLPMLPTGLLRLICDHNQLTLLPELPATLGELACHDNQLTGLPALPNALGLFWIHNNPALQCMPPLALFTATPTYFNISNTAITCFPNIINTYYVVPIIDTMPICSPGDPCSIIGGCNTVTGIASANVSAASALIYWNSETSALKYRIRVKNMGTGVQSVLFINASDTTKILTGLASNTLHKVQVRAQCSIDGSILSSWSSPIYFTTLSGVAINCIPPTNPSATSTSGSTAVVDWTPVTGSNGYQLRFRTDGSTSWTPVVINDGLAASTTLSTLQPNSTYQYQMRTKCSTNPLTWSNYSAIQSFTTPLRLGEFENIAFEVYPNPAITNISVQRTSSTKALIQVTDLTGKVIFNVESEQKQKQLSLENLSAGVYLIRLLEDARVTGMKKVAVIR